MKSLFTITLCLILGVASAWSAHEDERDKLSQAINGALDALYSPECADHAKEEKMARVREVLEGYYDFDVVIRRTIGRNWRSFSPEQQVEVLELVKQIVMKAYVNGMDGLERPEVSFEDVVSISEKRIEIGSRVVLGEAPVAVVYRLGKMKSGWQIYDVVVEGVSLVSNYRQQINDHFRKGDATTLISKLKDLNQSDQIDGTTKI